ncbi:MAG TPA: ATP-binding protein [Pyrinomonadaceae bacterium]|nr:ATP-binding protein [Pyrinomonadaceae bacterium]
MRDSEEQYRILFESNPHPMWVYATDTLRFLAVNETAINLYGYSREEFLRMTIKDIRPPEDVPMLLDDIERTTLGADSSDTWRHLKKDGTIVFADINSHSIIFDGRDARLVLAEDVTERRLAEEALRVAEQRAIIEYERLLDRLASLAQAFGTARDLTIIFRALREFATASTPCNGTFISLYDAERNERTAVYAWSEGEEIDLSSLPPLPLTGSPHSRAVATGKIIVTEDFQSSVEGLPVVNVAYDRNARPPRSSLAVPMTFMGRTLGAIEVQSPHLADFKPEHATAMRMAANLAAVAIENVRLLERELARADQQAETEKMRSVGQLAAGVAHDFNNSLAAILGRTQLLLRNITDEKHRRGLEVIETAALDAAETVRRIQTFARRTPAQQLSGVSVARLINDAIQLTRTRWEDDARARGLRYDINFTTDVEGDDAVAANPSELREVMVNLIFNALDAMPSGGRVSVTERRHNDFVRIEVADTGEGISPDIADRIFEPFFTTKGPHGSGLGLAISYGIIQRHAGTIEVSSQIGQGATFIIHLPQMKGTAAPSAGVKRISLPARRVLVVEDEPVVREVLVEILAELNQDVVAVASAAEAFDIVAAAPFDLLITDLAMPDMDGLTLATEVRKRAPGMMIMLATGYGQIVPGNAPKPGLVDIIINKPFQVSDIEASLLALYTNTPIRREASITEG